MDGFTEEVCVPSKEDLANKIKEELEPMSLSNFKPRNTTQDVKVNCFAYFYAEQCPNFEFIHLN